MKKIITKIINKTKRILTFFFIIFRKTFNKFYNDQGFIISNGLAFKTIIALVPVLLIIVSTFKIMSPSFNIYKEKLIDLLKNFIVPSSFEVVTLWIEKILDKTGTINLISIIIFFYLTLDLLFTLDKQIERMWSIKKNQSIIQKILKYWMLLTATPLLLSGYFYYSGFIRSFLEAVPFFDITFLENIIFNVISFVLLCFFFFIIYFVIPSAKVHLSKSLIVSFVVTILWLILRSIYTYYTVMAIGKWSIIYGSLASLMFFVLWTSVNWIIVLFSVEFLSVWQNKLYMAKVNFQKLFLFDVGLIIFVLKQFFQDFKKSGDGITAKMLTERLQYNINDIREILDILLKENFIMSNNKTIQRYYLKKDINMIRLSEIESIVWDRLILLQNKATEELRDICDKLGMIYFKKKNKKAVYLKDLL